ncbi:MAG: hypothetical protein AABX77_00365 [Nanoarchaeota archaeon]
MVSWVVIAIIIILILIIVKLSAFKHKFFMILLILLSLFLLSSIFIVSKENRLDFSTTEGFFNAIKVYTGWLANGFKNLKDLTGRVINMDWKSSNETFFDKNKKK